jgi:type I restriction enzyme M protein
MATKKTTAKVVAPKKAAKPQPPAFQQVFKAVDDLLRKDEGCNTELDYTEQSSWLLFLKYLDALEQDREQEAKLMNKKYEYILDKKYRWSVWAAPRNAQGAIDYNAALTGEDLMEFVNGKLFPYPLKAIGVSAEGVRSAFFDFQKFLYEESAA